MQRQGVSTRVPKNHEYWVYIMASASGTLYVGMTNDLGVRVRQHKTADIEGFSKRYHCDRLVYYESYDWVHRAIDREYKISITWVLRLRAIELSLASTVQALRSR
jgi:putative endonuclease